MSTPPVCLHTVDRDNFKFFHLLHKPKFGEQGAEGITGFSQTGNDRKMEFSAKWEISYVALLTKYH
jgi:hypothetical protein